MAAISEKWSAELFPYTHEVIRAFFDPSLTGIVLMWATQLAKTTTVLAGLLATADNDPGPAIFIGPTEGSIRNFSRTRLYPMLEGCKPLSPKLKPKHERQELLVDLGDMLIFLGWSGSASQLGERTCRRVFCTELDKWTYDKSLEGDPEQLVMERVKAYPGNYKIIKEGTPTIKGFSRVENAYQKSDMRKYHVPCPHCGEYQALVFPQIKGVKNERDETRKPADARKHAYYECVHCHEPIRDHHKLLMLQSGRWVPEGQRVEKNGSLVGKVKNPGASAGFHLSSLYSNTIGFGQILQKFLEVKDKPWELQNFINSWLAETWEDKSDSVDVEQVERLIRDYPEGEVPKEVQVLTAYVDTQKDHHYLTVRGWGYNEESWLIRASRLENWAAVIAACFKTKYARKGGGPNAALDIRLTLFDARYRTDEVYELCRQYHTVSRPAMGAQKLIGPSFKISKIDRNPGTGQVIPGGLMLVHIDTNFYKDKISRFMAGGDEALWHIFEDPTDNYLEQITSEHKVAERNMRTGAVKELWRLKPNRKDNHYFDCEVGNLAAADLLGVSSLRAEGVSPVYQPRPRKSGFVKRGGSWLRG